MQSNQILGRKVPSSKQGDAEVAPLHDHVIPWDDRIEGSIARSRKQRGGNYVQLATVDGEGHPRCRTVVFRGFQALDTVGSPARSGPEGPPSVKEGGAAAGTQRRAFRMITDARSEKVAHAAEVPKAELVWWFAKSSEQYRVAGDLEIVGPGATGERAMARKAQWGNLSDSAREQFFWAAQPGAVLGQGVAGGASALDSSTSAIPAGGRDPSGSLLPPPDTFLLVLLWPIQVKFLRLTDNYSQIDRFNGTAWTASPVSP